MNSPVYKNLVFSIDQNYLNRNLSCRSILLSLKPSNNQGNFLKLNCLLLEYNKIPKASKNIFGVLRYFKSSTIVMAEVNEVFFKIHYQI